MEASMAEGNEAEATGRTLTVERQPGDEPAEPKKSYAPDPFKIATDVLAGVHLAESRRFRRSEISFDEKPSQPVIDKLKESGFRWNGQDRLWAKRIDAPSALQDRIDAERTYQDVAKMIREERGITHDVGGPGF
jgi:hypothetical protein